ncbi:hypothetical protein BGZ61DRAFT_16274 [Ilyonectria robusta]|uniref:uncharacterized protein n=1 Tax=Ilyonectria robusta TaxID=1079257 RepID=UPI001E8DB94C|nr:uncharacterized protein BGZ61DRAFT_16274 [Ilyonectria robusta]KAH8737455.1 hypothetical protein BGZ61DRAFT_16274 [Ilyonectria robusta]
MPESPCRQEIITSPHRALIFLTRCNPRPSTNANFCFDALSSTPWEQSQGGSCHDCQRRSVLLYANNSISVCCCCRHLSTPLTNSSSRSPASPVAFLVAHTNACLPRRTEHMMLCTVSTGYIVTVTNRTIAPSSSPASFSSFFSLRQWCNNAHCLLRAENVRVFEFQTETSLRNVDIKTSVPDPGK